jgi:DNA invertase Pin-like site-specific DNA recombinase
MATARISPMAGTDPIVAAAVSRVSLKLQADNFSLKAQHNRIEELCRQHNLRVPEEYLLDDGGYSGSSFNRPAFQKTVQLVREAKVGAVVFPYTDRFSRGNIENGLRMIRELREAGAKVILGEIGLVTDEAHVTIILSTLLGISQAQRNSIIEKSKAGALQKVKEGQPHGARLLYGYHGVTKAEIIAQAIRAGEAAPEGRVKNYMARVESEIKTLRLMKELIEGGSGLRAVARELTARGIPTKRGGKWAPATISDLVNCDSYHTGDWYYNKREKREVKAEHWRNRDENAKHYSQVMKPRSEWVGMKLPGDPVFTKTEQLAMRAQVLKNGGASNGKPVAEGGRESMLKTMTVCRACGKAIIMWQKSYPQGQRLAWYKCSHRNRVGAGHLCEAVKSIRAEVLEDAIWQAWAKTMTVELPARVAEYFADLKREAGDAGVEFLRAQRAKLAKTRQAAMDKELEADAEEDRLHYANRVATLKAEITILDRRIAAGEMATPSVNVSAIQREMTAVVKTTDPRAKREALLATVEKIVWAGDETAGEADLHLRVPVGKTGAKCQRQEYDVDSYIPLKIQVKLAA